LNDIKSAIDIINKEISTVDLAIVKDIKKIYNKNVYETVSFELKKIMNKHPDIVGLDLIKHLFHGTKINDPSTIYSFETGLDMRYGQDGLNGIGLYFADNSKYSKAY